MDERFEESTETTELPQINALTNFRDASGESRRQNALSDMAMKEEQDILNRAYKKAFANDCLGYYKEIFEKKVAQGFEIVNGVKVKITDQATDPLGKPIYAGTGCIHQQPEEFVTLSKYLEDSTPEEIGKEDYYSCKVLDKETRQWKGLANIIGNMPNLRESREKEAAKRRERSMNGIKDYAEEKKYGKDFLKYRELQILAGVRQDPASLMSPDSLVEEIGSIMSNMERMMKEMESMHSRMAEIALQIESDD